MAFLFSKHDFYHVHAINGFIVLLHFLYRICLFVQFKNSFRDPNFVTVCCILMHGMLHISSFQFSLPKKRVMSRPLIWKEFRMHNAIFSFRHIFATLVTLFAPNWWTIYGGNIIFVVAANEAASYVTLKYGSKTKRTTNSMAYPAETNSNNIETTKDFYVNAQFGATSLCLYAPASINFSCLLGLQGASFLMTLGRKGIIRTIWYHRLYTACLFITYVMNAYISWDQIQNCPMQMYLFFITASVSKSIRMCHSLRASIHWICMVVLSQIVVRTLFYVGISGLFPYLHFLVMVAILFSLFQNMHQFRWMMSA